MAIRVYVLIETEVGKIQEVIKAIRALEGVVLVDAVTGPYDAIATIEAETLDKIGDMVTEKVHAINGISRTVTCLAVKTI